MASDGPDEEIGSGMRHVRVCGGALKLRAPAMEGSGCKIGYCVARRVAMAVREGLDPHTGHRASGVSRRRVTTRLGGAGAAS